MLTVDATAHTAGISYPDFGVHIFPPVHQATIHEATSVQPTDPWAAAIRAKVAGTPLQAPDPQDPTTWGPFVEGANDGERQMKLIAFQQWLRGRHGLTSTDFTQKGDFHFHSRLCMVRAVEQWVCTSQQNAQWRAVTHLQTVRETLIGLERYILFGQGGDLSVFGAELAAGKAMKEASAKALAKKH